MHFTPGHWQTPVMVESTYFKVPGVQQCTTRYLHHQHLEHLCFHHYWHWAPSPEIDLDIPLQAKCQYCGKFFFLNHAAISDGVNIGNIGSVPVYVVMIYSTNPVQLGFLSKHVNGSLKERGISGENIFSLVGQKSQLDCGPRGLDPWSIVSLSSFIVCPFYISLALLKKSKLYC